MLESHKYARTRHPLELRGGGGGSKPVSQPPPTYWARRASLGAYMKSSIVYNSFLIYERFIYEP